MSIFSDEQPRPSASTQKQMPKFKPVATLHEGKYLSAKEKLRLELDQCVDEDAIAELPSAMDGANLLDLMTNTAKKGTRPLDQDPFLPKVVGGLGTTLKTGNLRNLPTSVDLRVGMTVVRVPTSEGVNNEESDVSGPELKMHPESESRCDQAGLTTTELCELAENVGTITRLDPISELLEVQLLSKNAEGERSRVKLKYTSARMALPVEENLYRQWLKTPHTIPSGSTQPPKAKQATPTWVVPMLVVRVATEFQTILLPESQKFLVLSVDHVAQHAVLRPVSGKDTEIRVPFEGIRTVIPRVSECGLIVGTKDYRGELAVVEKRVRSSNGGSSDQITNVFVKLKRSGEEIQLDVDDICLLSK